jgi:shikimate dehydrogenase
MRRLGVLGWPVAHSRSPAMQNAALRAAGLTDWRYQALPLTPELFARTVRALPRAGFRGVNVTIPHKEAALRLADEASGSANAIGAANTLTFTPAGAIHAENTDAPALIGTLPFEVAGRSALVLGAGGSARAAVWALLDAGAGDVRVWNRTPERAWRLCAEIGGTPVDRVGPADLLVHCTSMGLDASEDFFKQLPLTADGLTGYECVVDLVYSKPPTQLTRTARAQQVAVVDGLALLLAQGVLSFELFTGQAAPVEAMRSALSGHE